MFGIWVAVNATTSYSGRSRYTRLKLWKSRPAAPTIRTRVLAMHKVYAGPQDGGTGRRASSGRRTVEGREESVARNIDFPSAEAVEMFSHDCVMPRHHVAPAPVAEPFELLGRAHDVGEEHRRQNALRPRRRPHAREKALDLREHRFLVPEVRRMGRSRKLDVASVLD